jgi:hypothetical protein
MSCKAELKTLAKQHLSDQQRTVLEGIFRVFPENEHEWLGCFFVAGIKHQYQWYNKAWFGALVASSIFLLWFVISWMRKK